MKKITLILATCLLTQVLQAQNSCTTALPITAGEHQVGIIDGQANPLICAGNGAATAAEWYAYTPTQNYMVTVTTDLEINSGKDTRFHVYTGSCNNLTCYSGDDDEGVIGSPSYLSIASFAVIRGNTYYIAFDNRWNASNFQFNLTEETPAIIFSPQTIATSSSICSGADMNGDYLDDIVTVQANQMTVLTQRANGGFTTTIHPLPGLTTLPGWSISAGDFDKNGFNDLVLGGASRLTVVKANSTGTGYTEIPYPQSIFTQRTNFIDINNDGHLDLFACHDLARSHAYRNDGNGNLIFDVNFFPTLAVGGNYASIWTDYDNDGDQDMYLSKCRGGAPVGDPQRINLLYKNNGNGTFTESGAVAGVNDGSQSWSTAVEDFDNDGDMDFLISNISDQNKFYINNGDGTFTDIYSQTGIASQVGSWELQTGDFNNDGYIDFLWQNGKELYLNNGDLTFTGYDLPFSEGAIGDFNNDGYLDVQFMNQVYYNVPVNDNHWIKVNLKGIQSNANGIGARVEIEGAWGKQIREIRSGNGFSHQSSLNAHFGIGTHTTIDKITVKWPSGTVDVIQNVPSNQSVLVTEGNSLNINSSQNKLFSIYPNPAKDLITIQMKANQSSIAEVKIYDLVGKLVLEPSIIQNTLDVKSLSSGTYILTLKNSDGEKSSLKFIKA